MKPSMHAKFNRALFLAGSLLTASAYALEQDKPEHCALLDDNGRITNDIAGDPYLNKYAPMLTATPNWPDIMTKLRVSGTDLRSICVLTNAPAGQKPEDTPQHGITRNGPAAAFNVRAFYGTEAADGTGVIAAFTPEEFNTKLTRPWKIQEALYTLARDGTAHLDNKLTLPTYRAEDAALLRTVYRAQAAAETLIYAVTTAAGSKEGQDLAQILSQFASPQAPSDAFGRVYMYLIYSFDRSIKNTPREDHVLEKHKATVRNAALALGFAKDDLDAARFADHVANTIHTAVESEDVRILIQALAAASYARNQTLDALMAATQKDEAVNLFGTRDGRDSFRRSIIESALHDPTIRREEINETISRMTKMAEDGLNSARLFNQTVPPERMKEILARFDLGNEFNPQEIYAAAWNDNPNDPAADGLALIEQKRRDISDFLQSRKQDSGGERRTAYQETLLTCLAANDTATHDHPMDAPLQTLLESIRDNTVGSSLNARLTENWGHGVSQACLHSYDPYRPMPKVSLDLTDATPVLRIVIPDPDQTVQQVGSMMKLFYGPASAYSISGMAGMKKGQPLLDFGVEPEAIAFLNTMREAVARADQLLFALEESQKIGNPAPLQMALINPFENQGQAQEEGPSEQLKALFGLVEALTQNSNPLTEQDRHQFKKAVINLALADAAERTEQFKGINQQVMVNTSLDIDPSGMFTQPATVRYIQESLYRIDPSLQVGPDVAAWNIFTAYKSHWANQEKDPARAELAVMAEIKSKYGNYQRAVTPTPR